ncbi:hypothetical protein GOBAR_DD24036 [Gossypium barbadense]|nr:hypothetical protein GOBAR_DD24036 [Gossypium barbadense]
MPSLFGSNPSSSDPANDTLYYRPVIGILSHPGDGASGRLNNDTNASYIAASYVKFVEAAGARVIPLIYNEPEEILFQCGISPEKLQNTPNLSRFFKILTTSTDKNNKVYVSTAQAHGYPVTAFQWHPEKNAFEWGLSMIPHSDDAIEVTQHVANFFIREARRSLNRPAAQKVLDSLIYNYSPTYCGKAGKGFDEVYIFTLRQARI